MNTMLWRFSLVLVLVCTFNAGAVEPVLPQNAYRMGANDVIRIQVFGEDDLTVEGVAIGVVLRDVVGCGDTVAGVCFCVG